VKIPLKKMMFSALSLLGEVYKTGGVPILLYHSVDDEDSLIATPTEMFRMQMEYLVKEHINVLSLKELYEKLMSPDPLPKNSAVITFDDGFQGMFHNAFPILREFAFPATVFVVTDYVGKPMGWERIDGIPAHPLCSWDELGTMSEGGVDVQSHTMRHPFMTELSESDLASEVEGSVSAIERELGKKVEFLAYPYGAHNPLVVRVLKERGIVGGVAGGSDFFGKVTKGQDPYSLERVGTEFVSGRDQEMLMNFFRASIAGTSMSYIWLRNKVPLLAHRPGRKEYLTH